MSPYKLGLAVVALLTGCAGAPRAQAPAEAISGCSELQTEIAAAEEAKRAAMEKQQHAWKAIVPFAVAARYADAKSAAADADQRV